MSWVYSYYWGEAEPVKSEEKKRDDGRSNDSDMIIADEEASVDKPLFLEHPSRIERFDNEPPWLDMSSF